MEYSLCMALGLSGMCYNKVWGCSSEAEHRIRSDVAHNRKVSTPPKFINEYVVCGIHVEF